MVFLKQLYNRFYTYLCTFDVIKQYKINLVHLSKYVSKTKKWESKAILIFIVLAHIQVLLSLFWEKIPEEFFDENILNGLFYAYKASLYFFVVSLFSRNFRNIKELCNPEIWQTFPEQIPGTGLALLMIGGGISKKVFPGICIGCLGGVYIGNDYYKEAFGVSPIREIGNVRTGEQTWEEAKDKIWNPQKYRGAMQLIDLDSNFKIDESDLTFKI